MIISPPSQVGTFLILKSEESLAQPSLWRVDGRTLIQKYSCCDGVGRLYKCVNTFSGWTNNTRHRYRPVTVRPSKSSDGDSVVEWIKEEEGEGKEEAQSDTREAQRKDSTKSTTKKINLE